MRTYCSHESEVLVEEVYTPAPAYVKTTTDQEEVAELMKNYDLNAIAVVDNDLRLVGIITIDDIVDIIEEEATEDIHKMAGMNVTATSYFHTSPFVFIKEQIALALWPFVVTKSKCVGS